MINPSPGKTIIIISHAQVVEGSFRSININENEKQELIDAVDSLLEIINIIKND
jgi:histidyl-tRNA synthetase